MYNGTEQFTSKGQPTGETVADFWGWLTYDTTDGSFRTNLAKFIVASSLGLNGIHVDSRCDVLTKDGIRIAVKASSYIESGEPESPDHISFSLDPFDTVSDVHVFCICTALISDQDPIDLDLWDFYVIPTDLVDDSLIWQKTVTLPRLLELHPYMCDYNGIREALEMAT